MYSDPFGGIGDDLTLTKAHHVIGLDDEVVYVPTGHKGKVTNIAHGTYYVTMPTGHTIACSVHDLCPADFPSAERPAPVRIGPPREDPVASKLAGFLSNAGGLMRAMHAGSLSDRDRVAVKRHFDNVKAHRDTIDPFGLGEESWDVRMLKVYAEKYADTSGAGDTFTKATMRPDQDPEFKLGDLVRCKVTGKKGKIVRLDYGFADLDFGNGNTGVSACGTLEACAA